MEVLSLKPGHDGALTLIKNGYLEFCFENEKNSYDRNSEISPDLFITVLENLEKIPDIVAVSGWVKGFHSIDRPVLAGYFGHKSDSIINRTINFFGHSVDLFSSTHERSHIMSAYAMSPWPQGQECYVLVWEGNIGAFYKIDGDVNIVKLADILEDPGNKYAFLYTIADPNAPIHKGYLDFSNAGKQMALAGFAKQSSICPHESKLINDILNKKSILLSSCKMDFIESPFYNIGIESQAFKNLAAKFSDAIFEKFHTYAQSHLKENIPLLISGGCGLNGDWNTKWKESSIFSDIFIPPCPNDSGSAIGTAVDAQFYYTGEAKIEWNVYSGAPFIMDISHTPGFSCFPLDHAQVAKLILDNYILAWVQGNCEIGPRALGNRSILCSPFNESMRKKINIIKDREQFRPVAPICLEKDVCQYFYWNEPSPYMLFFPKAKTRKLKAVTHIDQTSRIQTVNKKQNKQICILLEEFKKISGFSVLCNTSLNFKGKGFINSMSELIEFAIERKLNGFVVEKNLYIRQ